MTGYLHVKQGKRSERLISVRCLFMRIDTTDRDNERGETAGEEFRTKGEIICERKRRF